ncbi:MAG: hypothetical protein WBA61_12305 [Aequorivita sp.]
MKNMILLLIVTLTLPLLNSCTVKDRNLDSGDYSLDAKEQSEFQKSLLINLQHARPQDFDADVKITESKIENIDGIFYLRTFFNNNFVSTTLLRISEDNGSLGMRIDPLPYGITCTSSSCHSGSGCTPKLNGDCTDCNSGSKDCTRSLGT